MTNYPTTYSDTWMGQDGREWRNVSYWVGSGYRTFLQVRVNGEWTGY